MDRIRNVDFEGINCLRFIYIDLRLMLDSEKKNLKTLNNVRIVDSEGWLWQGWKSRNAQNFFEVELITDFESLIFKNKY